MEAVETLRMNEMSGKCMCVWLVCEVRWVAERFEVWLFADKDEFFVKDGYSVVKCVYS